MLLSVTLSKPCGNIEEFLDKPYEKIKIKIENSASGLSYFAEMFTKTQVFHKHFSEQELNVFLDENIGKTFKNCVKRTESEEITILTSKKGKTTSFTKKIDVAVTKGTGLNSTKSTDSTGTGLKSTKNEKIGISTKNTQLPPSLFIPNSQKKKNYLLPEGTPVPFLILLGIMNSEGKVINAKYDKFRQINRYLEFINDILPELTKNKGDRPLRVVDFGCGKSYLTFAVQYFLSEVKHIPCQIEGLDLKKDVIDYCNQLTQKLNLENLIFHTGNISDYSNNESPDLVITLHACDTATDYALEYAVEKKAGAILSVPCCQHQINQQLSKSNKDNEFESLLKWGIIREKFSALLTDALRGQWLEENGYNVQLLEFIDMEHTPKNILIRAVRKSQTENKTGHNKKIPSLIEKLGIEPEIWKNSLK